MRTPQDGARAIFLSPTTGEGTMRFPNYHPPSRLHVPANKWETFISLHTHPQPIPRLSPPSGLTMCPARGGLLIPMTPLSRVH